jgi:hypothetical protein
MIITRKAIVGFVLLGLIVFATTQYTVSQMQKIPKIASNTSAFGISQPLQPGPQSYMVKSMKYQPPIVSLGNNAPYAATAIIELFTLGCYLVLKRYEQNINGYAVSLIGHYRS